MSKSYLAVLVYTIASTALMAISFDAGARGLRGAVARGLGGAAGAAASGPVLSQAELRRCLETQETIDDAGPKLKSMKDQLDAEQAKLEKVGATIQQRRDTLDRTSQKAVDTFNATLRRHQKQAVEYRTKASAFNEQVASHRQIAEGFKESCAGKAYRESDMKAVIAQAAK